MPICLGSVLSIFQRQNIVHHQIPVQVPPAAGKKEPEVAESAPGWFQASGRPDGLLSWQHFFDVAINVEDEVLSCPNLEAEYILFFSIIFVRYFHPIS